MSRICRRILWWSQRCGVLLIGVSLFAGCTTYDRPGDLALVSLEAVDEHDQHEIVRFSPAELLLLELGSTTEELTNKGLLKDVRRHHRLLLKVTFTTTTDLNGKALDLGRPPDANSHFCDRPSDRVLLALSSVYWRGVLLPSPTADLEASRDSNDRLAYYFYLGVVREEKKPSHPPVKGHDLLNNTESVCSYIKLADHWGFRDRSNTIEIPKGMITDALKKLPPYFSKQ